MIPKNVTIKDIAKELGVSYSSVSRALNGKEGVSEATKQKIIKAAERAGYQPNDLARGLVNKISKTVGVIIPDINNPFFGEIVTGIIEAANENEYNVFLCTSNWDMDTEKANFSALRQKRVDGVIMKTVGQTARYNDVRFPLMLIESDVDLEWHQSIEIDNVLGGYIAVKHLFDCGYRNPAVILGKEDMFASRERLKGAKQALAEFSASIEEDNIIIGSFSIEGGRVAAKQLFEKNRQIDAVFAMNDLIGMGVLHYCSEAGIRVPDEVGVVGFDNIIYAGFPQIELTTVHQPKHELGRLLFETILEEIRSEKTTKVVKKVSLNPELKIRKTTTQVKE